MVQMVQIFYIIVAVVRIAHPTQTSVQACILQMHRDNGCTDVSDYCKRIAQKQAQRAAQGLEDRDSDPEASHRPLSDDEDGPFIHHPFKVKEAPIIMNIRVRATWRQILLVMIAEVGC